MKLTAESSMAQPQSGNALGCFPLGPRAAGYVEGKECNKISMETELGTVSQM